MSLGGCEIDRIPCSPATGIKSGSLTNEANNDTLGRTMSRTSFFGVPWEIVRLYNRNLLNMT